VRTLVLGLGNDLAGDDAIGVLAARSLRDELDGAADVAESSASGLALIEVLAGYDRAVIVDSIRTGRHAPGTIVEMALEEVGRVVAPSLHHAGLAELAAVAGRLGLRFPARTRVLAVEVVDPYTLGAGLTPPVEAALPALVDRVRALLDRWGTGEPDELAGGDRARLPRRQGAR
jgi:hydrogenase maturation protease